MAILRKAFAFEYTPETTAKVVDYVKGKQPPRVVSQTPAPGTPVLEGMTIEIHVVSDSDVPVVVFDPAIPPLVKNVSVADMSEIIDSDPDIKGAVAAGNASPLVTEKFNRALNQRGVMGGLSVDEASALMKSLKGLSFGAP
jgi:hypothetical protein